MNVESTSCTVTRKCDHCGLALGASPIVDDDVVFCCTGCEAVYRAIHGLGLSAYYRSREGVGVRVQGNESDFSHFDDETFQAAHVTGHDDSGHVVVELHLEGLHCSACVWLVEKLPSLVAGVKRAQLNYAEGRVEVVWEPSSVKLSRIARTLRDLGYTPHLSVGDVARRRDQAVGRKLLAKMGIAGAAFGNVMLLGSALYSGEGGDMTSSEVEFFRWMSLVITVPAVLYSASTFFRGALAAVRTRTAHMDVPISIGIAVALVSGTANTIRGQGEIYFDSVTMLVFFLLVGRWLSARQLSHARHATDMMLSLAPSTCRVIGETGIIEVPTDSVQPGTLVEVSSGQRISVDGRVVEGTSTVDRSLLNGESKPTRVVPGDEVHAGTVNLSERLVVRVTVTGKETRLAHIVAEVARAARAKVPHVELANRLSAYFVWVVLALSALAVFIALPLGLEEAINRAVSVLIVTCPCALGLATPLVGSVALARATRRGILIKGAQFLEALARPGLFVFDKTGTLTAGKVELVDWDGSEELLSLVSAAEASSAHPVAKAFSEAWAAVKPEGSAARSATSASEQLGGGVEARVDGHEVHIGSRRFVQNRVGAAAVHACREREHALVQRGLSPVFVAVDGSIHAVAGFGDPLRPDARDCLLSLQKAGYRLAVLSGDQTTVALRVASELGISFDEVLGEQSPEQKLSYIERAQKKGPVFMVGDGVNDAGALCRADVGIAVFGGAEASLSAADVFSTRAGLAPVVELQRGAHRTMRLIRRNLVFSLSYNALAAGLALAGYIHPLLAAILMPLSSLTVVVNTLRTRSFDEEALGSPSSVAAPDDATLGPRTDVHATPEAA